VDYAAVEAAIGASAARTTHSAPGDFAEVGHRCCGGRDRRSAVHASRTVRGAVPHDGGVGVGGTVVVPTIWRTGRAAGRQGGRCGEPASGSRGRRVVARYGASHGARGPARNFPRGRSDGQRISTAALLPK
jgi:hypothetical protein